MPASSILDKLISLDKDLFLFLNGMHAPWLDPIMVLVSETLFWLPLHAFLLYLIVKEHKVMSILILVGIALTILLSDQVTSSLMKPFFTRLRPSYEPSFEGLVHLVNGYKGGKYGFASSHAANTFGTATFLCLLFRKSKPWITFVFLWAALVSYSRIYLGVHYPGDIITGGGMGMLFGWISFVLYSQVRKLMDKRKAPSMP